MFASIYAYTGGTRTHVYTFALLIVCVVCLSVCFICVYMCVSFEGEGVKLDILRVKAHRANILVRVKAKILIPDEKFIP